MEEVYYYTFIVTTSVLGILMYILGYDRGKSCGWREGYKYATFDWVDYYTAKELSERSKKEKANDSENTNQ